MRAYSLDLRERVVSAYQNGVESIREVSEQFQVSENFLKKMLARQRRGDDLAPRSHGGGKKKTLSESVRKWILKTVLGELDITLADLQERDAGKKQLKVSVPTLSRELRGLNLRLKKNQWRLQNGTPGNEPDIGGR